mmetsp:Transcript_34899/g.86633  ORF Transcript_34899/g.86633 Transcript_34899/m.86633 type:complete len:351 (-) Transcript_34899:41-1093(-)
MRKKESRQAAGAGEGSPCVVCRKQILTYAGRKGRTPSPSVISPGSFHTQIDRTHRTAPHAPGRQASQPSVCVMHVLCRVCECESVCECVCESATKPHREEHGLRKCPGSLPACTHAHMHMDDKRQASACITLTASRWAGLERCLACGSLRTHAYVWHSSIATKETRREERHARKQEISLYLSLSLSYARGRAVLRSTAFIIVVGSFFPHSTTQHQTTCTCRASPSHPSPSLSVCQRASSIHPLHVGINAWHAPLLRSQNRMIGSARKKTGMACSRGWRHVRMAQFSFAHPSPRSPALSGSPASRLNLYLPNPSQPTEAHHTTPHHTTPDQSVKRKLEGTSQQQHLVLEEH